MRSFLLAALLVCAFAASAQQLYRWTDEHGRVHVTDTPPPSTAKNVRQRDAEAASSSGDANLPYAVQRAAKDYPVTLFTAPDCAPCGPARTLLNQRGVPFREVRVVDEKQAEELTKAVGSLSVPSLRVGSSVQKGFEQGACHALLDTAGYPRTGILPPRSQAEPKPEPAKPAAAKDAEADEEPAAGPYKPR